MGFRFFRRLGKQCSLRRACFQIKRLRLVLLALAGGLAAALFSPAALLRADDGPADAARAALQEDCAEFGQARQLLLLLMQRFGDRAAKTVEDGRDEFEAARLLLAEYARMTATARVPILMYHMIVEDYREVDSVRRRVSDFEGDLLALLAAGFNTITFAELISYARGESLLPQNPVIITFDDGYLDNYTLAFPLLVEHEMRAAIFVIGWSRGRSARDSGTPINPHFSLEQAADMMRSGFVDIQSHSFQMHERLSGPYGRRSGILQNIGEAEYEYVDALLYDMALQLRYVFGPLGHVPTVFAYPGGLHSPEAERVLRGAGFLATVLTEGPEAGASHVARGQPDSLFGLRRINVSGWMTSEELVERMRRELSPETAEQ